MRFKKIQKSSWVFKKLSKKLEFLVNSERPTKNNQLKIQNLETEIQNLKISLENYTRYSNRIPFINEATFRQVSFFESIKKSLIPPLENIELVRFGRDRDGGYVMAALPNPNYRVFSAGAGDDISFEIALCDISTQIILVDHTLAKIEESHPNLRFMSKKLVPLGQVQTEIETISIDEAISTWPTNLFENWVLKIDIEGDEWEILFRLDPQILEKFSQILVEFHGISDAIYFPGETKRIETVLEKISKNFIPINLHANNHAISVHHGIASFPDVLEVSYLSKRIFESLPKVQKKNQINFPNNPYKPDVSGIFGPLY
jgi:hypothetical protein